MFNFLKKSNEGSNSNQTITNSTEYEKLSKRITDLVAEIQSVKANVDSIQTSLDNLRGNFNRKLKGLAEEEIKEKKSEEDKKENFNNDGFVPFG